VAAEEQNCLEDKTTVREKKMPTEHGCCRKVKMLEEHSEEKKWSKGTTIAGEQKCPETAREQICSEGVQLFTRE